MADNFAATQERRAFTRLTLDSLIEVRQGSKVWPLQLLDISLTGLGVSEPDDWDADYSHPFSFMLRLDGGRDLEFHAHLVHMDPGHIGFELAHLDPEPLNDLAATLAGGLGRDVIDHELTLLASLQD
ncbi:PilZ domain-containing protein [Candidatus Litorirhabdus singularis]|nr:PilZ domain-containing protein [Candidatus Litorirhabdus singularis]